MVAVSNTPLRNVVVERITITGAVPAAVAPKPVSLAAIASQVTPLFPQTNAR